MSYANGTQFYNLPQTVGTDKRDWFDTNSPFAAIDAALHAAVVGQASDAEAIATINSKLATDEADIAALQTKTNTHDSQIATLQTTVNAQAAQITDVRQDAEDMITANNEGAAATSTKAYSIGDYFIYNDVLYKATAAIAVGDTIVPNTNCEATNVDTELTQVNNDLTPELVYFDGNADNFLTIYKLGREVIVTLSQYNITSLDGSVYDHMPLPQTAASWCIAQSINNNYRLLVDLSGNLTLKTAGGAAVTETVNYVNANFTYICRES